MAEVLGAVASGLAVAEVGLKVGGTVWKLKELWKQVHDVPETIQDLMKQIEIMDPVLYDHETKFGVPSADLLEPVPTRNTPQAKLSAEYCRKALEDLRNLVEELSKAIESEKRTRRTFARMRVVLKKDMIKGFQERMDRATKLLQCTQVNYLVANATMTGAMILDMWTAVQQQLNNKKSSSSIGMPPFALVNHETHKSQKPTHMQVSTKGIRRQASRILMSDPRLCLFGALIFDQSKTETGSEATYALRFQLPNWLSSKVWDITVNRACFGWEASLTTWNIVPDDSPSIACVKKGDLDGLMDLFNRGLASPRDCNFNGDTLFYLAASHAHAHIVQHFCNANLDRPFIDSVTFRLGPWLLTQFQLPMDILRQLVSRGLIDALAGAAEEFEFLGRLVMERLSIPLISGLFLIIWTSFSPEAFELGFRRAFPFWHNLSPRQKQGILMTEWECQNWNTACLGVWAAADYSTWPADALRLILSPDRHVRPVDVQTWIDDGASILHQVFVYFLRPESETSAQDWAALLKEVLEATEDLHFRLQVPCVDYIGACSALELALVGVLGQILTYGRHELCVTAHEWSTHRLLKRTIGKLQLMMSIIASCGHDLLEFGRREAKTWYAERSLHRNPNVGDTLYLGLGGQPNGFPYIRAVHYGSDPKQWYFEMDFYYEDYAGDFWHLLENPHLYMMPGAWIDED